MLQKIDILGVPVHPVSLSQARERIVSFLKAGVPGRKIYSINPEIVMAARESEELAQALAEGSLNLADGIGIVKAGKILKRNLPERVGGIDLLVELLRVCAAEKFRLFILAGKPGVAERAAEKIKERYPDILIVGTNHGYFTPTELPAVKDAIKRATPHILFVGLGCPRQELFMDRETKSLVVPVSMAVGGSFDVLAGDVKRAPLLWQRFHLEWLYRIISQPKRWRRAFVLPKFINLVVKERFWPKRNKD